MRMGGRLLVAFMVLLCSSSIASAHNTTHILANYPTLSTFNKYLAQTGVVHEIDTRSSLTVLIPPNKVFDPVVQSVGASNLLLIADILRYHCVLQYLEVAEIRSMTNSTGILLTTLYQTTGRATGQLGFLNISVSRTGAVHLGVPVPGAGYNSSIVTNITQFPYNVSYMEIDHVLMPAGLGVAQGAAPSIANVTQSLKKKGGFSTLLSLLDSTGVETALKGMSAVTLFAPTDDSFKKIPSSEMDMLSPAQKIDLVQFHALPTYFTLGSLKTVAAPLPTVASGTRGSFALNVSSSADTVTILTGLNKATVISTILDQPPVAVYAVSDVLLPPEVFANLLSPAGAPTSSSPERAPSPSPVELTPVPAPSPDVLAPAPDLAPESALAPAPESALSPGPVAASPPAPPLSGSPSPSDDANAPAADTKNSASVLCLRASTVLVALVAQLL